MTSSRGVIFPTSMADFLANPVDIYFGFTPQETTIPAACLVTDSVAATSF
jgi:hypothetical protein